MSVSLLYWRRRVRPKKEHMTIFTGSVRKIQEGWDAFNVHVTMALDLDSNSISLH